MEHVVVIQEESIRMCGSVFHFLHCRSVFVFHFQRFCNVCAFHLVRRRSVFLKLVKQIQILFPWWCDDLIGTIWSILQVGKSQRFD